jgi:hypothetical protein
MSKASDKNTSKVQREFAPDDFYRAFAIAILQWQAVEHNLYMLFYKVVVGATLEESGIKYYKCLTFGKKLTLVNDAAKTCLVGDTADQWRQLKSELKTECKNRNALAHLTAVADFHEDGSLELVLAPGIFVPTVLVKKRRRLDTAECERLAFEFDKLAHKIEDFTSSF